MSRYLPDLIKGKRQRYTAEINGFVLERIHLSMDYQKSTYSYDKSAYSKRLQVRIHLTNIRDEQNNICDVYDATLPFSPSLRKFGMPDIKNNEKIIFKATPYVNEKQHIMAFKQPQSEYQNASYYINDNMLRQPAFYHVTNPDRDDIALIGLILKKYPHQIIKNKNGKTYPSGLDENAYDYYTEKTDRLLKMLKAPLYIFSYFHSYLFKENEVKTYQNVKNQNDQILVYQGKIITNDEYCEMFKQRLKPYLNLDKLTFLKRFHPVNSAQCYVVEYVYDQLRKKWLKEKK